MKDDTYLGRSLMMVGFLVLMLAALWYNVVNYAQLQEVRFELYHTIFWRLFAVTVGCLGLPGGIALFCMTKADGERDRRFNFAVLVGSWVVFLVVVGGICVIPFATQQTINKNWQPAITQQATYNQPKFGNWVGYRTATHECVESSTESGTGCRFFQSRGSGDDKKYIPYFKFERELFASYSVRGTITEVSFGRVPPQDWQSQAHENGSIPESFQPSEDPREWAVIRSAVDLGVALPVTHRHSVISWQAAHVWQETKHIATAVHWAENKYWQANLLPNRAPIQNNQQVLVQFSPTLTPPEQELLKWQQTAQAWASTSPVAVQWFFADHSLIADRAEWLQTAEKFLKDQSLFGPDILVGQQLAMLCTVDKLSSQITGCGAIDGSYSPESNQALKAAVAGAVMPIPFAPEAVFGNISVRLDRDPVTLVDEKGNAFLIVDMSGGTYQTMLTELFEPVGYDPAFVKLLKPTEVQENQIINRAFIRPWMLIFNALCFLIVVLLFDSLRK